MKKRYRHPLPEPPITNKAPVPPGLLFWPEASLKNAPADKGGLFSGPRTGRPMGGDTASVRPQGPCRQRPIVRGSALLSRQSGQFEPFKHVRRVSPCIAWEQADQFAKDGAECSHGSRVIEAFHLIRD